MFWLKRPVWIDAADMILSLTQVLRYCHFLLVMSQNSALPLHLNNLWSSIWYHCNPWPLKHRGRPFLCCHVWPKSYDAKYIIQICRKVKWSPWVLLWWLHLLKCSGPQTVQENQFSSFYEKVKKIFAYFPDYLHESAYIWPLRKGLIHVSCYILFHSVLFNSLHFVLDLITLLPESEVEIFICITGFLYLIFCIHISWSCCVYNCTVYLAERKGESDKRH